MELNEWRQLRLPPEAQQVRALLRHGERQMLYKLGMQIPSRKLPVIVDAGCFLGGSTLLMGLGLLDAMNGADNAAVAPRIVAYDLFRVDPYGRQWIRDTCGIQLSSGESFRFLFDEQTTPIRNYLEVHEGDFHHAQWNAQDEVSLLFLDLCKTESLNRHALKVFFPALRPETSFLVHQDFYFFLEPSIHIAMDLLDGFFADVGHEELSRAFRCVRPISNEVIDQVLISTRDKATALYSMGRQIEAAPSRAARAHLEVSKLQLIARLAERQLFEAEERRLWKDWLICLGLRA